ncbi:hypothetical protein ACVXZ4_01105 [Lacisediminihabitans sp. FW035]
MAADAVTAARRSDDHSRIDDDVGMESESPSIDPRYRPEFQRGYTGGAAPRPIVPAPRVDEPTQVGMPPAAAIDLEAAADAPSVHADQVTRRRNPYVFTIPVVALGFIVLGSWLLVTQFVWSYSGAFGSDNSVERRFTGVLSYVFSAPLVTVGLATLVGYVFWLAVRRQRP